MKTQKIDTVDDLFRIELKESMKIIKLQKYANSKWLIPHFVKDNELPSIFWDLYCKGAPYTEINGEETIESHIQRLKDCRIEVIKYYNTKYRDHFIT